MARCTRPWSQFLACCITLALGACAEDAAPTIVVTVDSELAIPEELYELELSVLASRTDSGQTCEPFTEVHSLNEPGDLPLEVALTQGPIYSSWLVYRVTALLRTSGGEQEFRRQALLRWPTTGVFRQTLLIEAAPCEPECESTEQCVDSQCTNVAEPTIFDDTARRDIGTLCLRSDETPE